MKLRTLTKIGELPNNRTIGTIAVSDFINLIPNDHQYKNGQHRITKSEVLLLVPKIQDALLDGSRVLLGPDHKIICGNHRYAAAKKALEQGSLDPAFVFPVEILNYEVTQEQLAIMAYNDNFGSNTKNQIQHIISGKFKISQHLLSPIYDSLEPYAKLLTNGGVNVLTKNLGGVFNNNKLLFDNLINGRTIDVMGAQIYQAKTYKECKDKRFFYEVDVNVDMRKYSRLLQTKLLPGLELIEEISQTSEWSRLLAGKKSMPRPLLYIILAASLRGEIQQTARRRGIITPKRAVSGMKKHSRKLRAAILNFSNDPVVEEETILAALSSEF